MADRVHPQDSPPSSADHHRTPPKPTPPPPSKPVPPPPPHGGGTYVIQIPKDQIYRVPPPENSLRRRHHPRRKTRRSSCFCRFLCYLISLVFVLIVLLGIAAAVLYLIFRPKAPNYTINGVSVKGVNLTSVATSSSAAAAISPEFDVAVNADNPNKKIGIYYEKDSSVEVFYKEIRLCNGELPAFYQPSRNVTVFQTVLRGSDIELTVTDAKALVNAQSKGSVPLTLKLRAPVKIKVGSVKTWRITVKVDCDVTVDSLTAKARVVSKSCDYGVDLW